MKSARIDLVSKLKRAGVADEKILQAVLKIPRERFMPSDYAHLAYADNALPIEEGQTISQPSLVGMMTQLLEISEKDKVLEIGTGSGYQTAILAEIAKEVATVELNKNLSEAAQSRLKDLGYKNILFNVGDGTVGWQEMSPFDAIIVTAAGPQVPPSLMNQLQIGGRLVIPVGKSSDQQDLLKIVRLNDKEFKQTDYGKVKFVLLYGAEGWRR